MKAYVIDFNLDASRILNARGLILPPNSEVPKLDTSQPKPSSSAGMAYTPYDAFDSIDGLSTSGAENEDTLTMSMIDFLQNEVTPPPKVVNPIPKPNTGYIKPFTSISSHAIGLISAMQQVDENMSMLDSANNFSDSLKMLSEIPADPVSEQFYSQITAQLQGQLAELTNKVATKKFNLFMQALTNLNF